MPRLTPVDPATVTGPAKDIFDGPMKTLRFNIFKSMGNSPAALNVYLGMSHALDKAALNAKEREVIQLAVGEANNCDYCANAHTAIGKMVGLTEAQTIEARRGTLSDAKLNAVAKFVLAIHEKRGFVSEGDVQAFKKAGYTDAHIAEAVACYALAIYTNYFNHVNETVSDFPAAPAI